MATDFRMNPSINPASIASLFQQQQAKQAELDQQAKQQQANNILAAADAASKMVSSAVEASKARQRRDAINSLANSLVSQIPNVMAPQQGPSLTGQPLPPVETPNYGVQNAIRSSVKLNPDSWNKELASQLLQSPLDQAKTKLDLARQQQLSGAVTPATQTLIQQMHEKIGKPAPDTSMMTEEQAQTYLGHAAKLLPQNSMMSPYAQVKRDALVDKMNKDLDKSLSPEQWSGTGPAATAAKIVVNAESAKALADQIISGKLPATRQAMSVLNADAARVVAQQGVITNEGRHELTNKTGYSDFAKALEYFTNNPQDQKANEFIKVLSKEMGRQQELRQKVVDNMMAKNLSAHQQLRKMDPDSWAAGLEAHNIDVEAAKKGKFKLKKSFIDSLQSDNQPSTSGGTDLGNGFSYTVK